MALKRLSSPIRAKVVAVLTATTFCIVGVSVFAAAAQETTQSGSTKFRLQDSRLIYDTINLPDDVTGGIQGDDAEVLRLLLKDNPEVTLLELNSGGGSLWASHKISDIVIDYGLDTHVNGECSSSCVRVFLAGEARSMSRGSRMGFHRYWWDPESVEGYYNREAEQEGWNDPFEFSSWVYEDTQREVHQALLYMVERGVDPVFAIETFGAQAGDMWFPYRIRLVAAGVLTK